MNQLIAQQTSLSNRKHLHRSLPQLSIFFLLSNQKQKADIRLSLQHFITITFLVYENIRKRVAIALQRKEVHK